MKLTVRLFAWARERVGSDAIEIELPEGATVSALRAELGGRYPDLGMASESVRIAVDEEFTTPEQELKDGSVAAIIPPVSGG